MRGRDIKRFSYNFADLYLINTHNGVEQNGIPPVNIDDYPAVKKHLDVYYSKLKEREDKGITPYNLRSCAYMEEFNKQKIVYQELTQGSQFAYDANGEYYINNTAYLITGKELKYLLAFLNSTLINFVYSRFYSTRIGGKGVRWLYQNMIMLPIIKREKLQKRTVKQINSLIDRVLTNENRTKKQMLDTEKLDILIYKIYKLTDEEMKFVSSSVRSK